MHELESTMEQATNQSTTTRPHLLGTGEALRAHGSGTTFLSNAGAPDGASDWGRFTPFRDAVASDRRDTLHVHTWKDIAATGPPQRGSMG